MLNFHNFSTELIRHRLIENWFERKQRIDKKNGGHLFHAIETVSLFNRIQIDQATGIEENVTSTTVPHTKLV